MTVGERMKRARQKLEKSQQAIADEVGCTQALVSYWETGQSFPSSGLVRSVAKAYGLKPEQLLPDESAA